MVDCFLVNFRFLNCDPLHWNSSWKFWLRISRGEGVWHRCPWGSLAWDHFFMVVSQFIVSWSSTLKFQTPMPHDTEFPAENFLQSQAKWTKPCFLPNCVDGAKWALTIDMSSLGFPFLCGISGPTPVSPLYMTTKTQCGFLRVFVLFYFNQNWPLSPRMQKLAFQALYFTSLFNFGLWIFP